MTDDFNNVDDVAELRAENAELRTRLSQLEYSVSRRIGAEPQPVVNTQVTTVTPGQGYDQDPRHDQEFIDAFTRYGPGSPEARAAFKAARERISAGLGGRPGQPPSIAEYDLADQRRRQSHVQRQSMAEAQKQLDLTGLPVAPGGTFHRDMETGQVTVTYPQARACDSGHPVGAADNFCQVCGSRLVGTAAEQTALQDGRLEGLDYYDKLDAQDRSLAEQRRREEGIIG